MFIKICKFYIRYLENNVSICHKKLNLDEF